MDVNTLTLDQLLAAEGYFTLATMVGKCLQEAVYILNHPDYKPKVVIFHPDGTAETDMEPDEPDDGLELAPADLINPGRLKSGEVSIDTQVEQAACLYDPRIREIIGDLPLYDMFSFAAHLFDYEPIDFNKELSPLNKRRAAVAWVMAKRAYAIFHMDEALHFLNLPDVLSGDIIYNTPLPSSRLNDNDKEFISIACGLCAQIIDNKTPLEDLIEQSIKNLEDANKIEKIGRLAPLSSVPNGDALGWLYRVVSNGSRIKRSNSNRHEHITEQRKGNAARYTRSNRQDESTVTVEIAQADKYLSKTSKTFKKLLLFSLQKMAAQHNPVEIGFTLQELVDLGMYANASNAIRGIREFFAQQKQTVLSGTVKKGRKLIREDGGILFYHYHIENGYVKLSVNDNFNLDFITNYYTVFPRFAYALSNNAFSLVRYIFFIARQNTKSIKDNGSFTISLDAVRENLGLLAPEDVKNRKYKQYIIDPIEEAIDEIGRTMRLVPEAKEYDFTITPFFPDSGNIRQWLEGYLKIDLKGDFAKSFIKLAINAEAQQEKWTKAKTTELAKLAAKKEAENHDSQ